jgi:uncharacterized membrane protein YkvI
VMHYNMSQNILSVIVVLLTPPLGFSKVIKRVYGVVGVLVIGAIRTLMEDV